MSFKEHFENSDNPPMAGSTAGWLIPQSMIDTFFNYHVAYSDQMKAHEKQVNRLVNEGRIPIEKWMGYIMDFRSVDRAVAGNPLTDDELVARMGPRE